MFSNYKANFHNKEIKQITFGSNLIWSGTLTALSNYSCKPRILDDYYMQYVAKGEGTLRSLKNTFSIKEGQIFFLFPGVLHSYKTDETNLLELWWIGFNGSNVADILNYMGISPENPVVDAKDSSDNLFSYFKSIVNSENDHDDMNEFSRIGILYNIFGLLSHKKYLEVNSKSFDTNEKSYSINKAINYIEANYKSDLKISDIANYVSLSKSYFYTKFKKEVGTSPNEYISSFRLKQATYYIKNTNMSIKDIAEIVGFNDPLYFSKVFSKKIGYSPTEYKNNLDKFKIDIGNKSSIQIE